MDDYCSEIQYQSENTFNECRNMPSTDYITGLSDYRRVYSPYTESRNLKRNPLVLQLQSRFDYNTAWPNKAYVVDPMHNPMCHGNNSFLTLVSDHGVEPKK